MTSLDRHRERVQSLSRRARAVVLAALAATPLAFAALLAWRGPAPLLPLPAGTAVDPAALSTGGWIALAALAVLRPVVFLAALVLLVDLFGRYGRGQVFATASIDRLRHLGWSLVGLDAAALVQGLLAGPLLGRLGAAEPFLALSIGVGPALIGLAVIVIARVMALGRALEELEELTV